MTIRRTLIDCHASDELHAAVRVAAGERALRACCGHPLLRGTHAAAAGLDGGDG